MADAATIGVLRDLSLFVGFATGIGIAGYRLMRHYRPQVSWNQEGLVPSRPYNAWDLLLVAALGVFFIVTSINPPSGPEADASFSTAGLVASMVFMLMVCAALLLYLSKLRGLNPAELFGFQHVHWRHILKVLAVFVPVCLGTVFVVALLINQQLEQVLPESEPQEMVQMFVSTSSIATRFLIILAAVIIAPLTEEIVFRGLVYGVLKRYTDAPFAALSSSLMFAIIHMHLGSLGPLWVLAVLFCIAYELTGCLLVPMILHMVFNSTSILLMLLMPEAGGGVP